MIDELIGYIPLFIATGIILYSIKRVSDLIKVKMQRQPKVKPKGPLDGYESIHDMLTQNLAKADMAISDIRKHASSVTNLEQEEGFKHIMERRNQVEHFKILLETNPLFMTLDQTFFPLVKDLIPKLTNMIKGLM